MPQAPNVRLGSETAEAPNGTEVREQLRRILDSPIFRRSRRCSAFLEYTVERSLAGEFEALKERNIAVDVFGRPPETNLTEDSIVRVGAREVRSRLAQYSMTPEASGDAIQIDLPAGSYIPEFRRAQRARTDAVEPPAVRNSAWYTRHSLAWIGCAALLTLAAVLLFWPLNSDDAAFHQFWLPLLHDPSPVLVAVAHPIVYHPSARATRLDREQLPAGALPFQHPLSLPPSQIDGSDMIPVLNQYVGFGDLLAASELSAFFSTQKKPMRTRMASKVEFADLKESPVVLIGAFTNRWTIQLSTGFRFRFVYTPDGRSAIQDASDARREWALPSTGEDGSSQEDYLLITRLPQSNSGKPILILGGLKQFGTEAGGRLLTTADHLGPILRKLPPDWASKNLQLILHARVIENSPTPPQVVASHLW